MSCSIIRNPETNKIEKVLAPNGKPSLLFQTILDMPEINGDKELALMAWAQVYTDEFKEWFGDWEKVPTAPISALFTKEDVLKLYNNQFTDFAVESETPRLKDLRPSTAGGQWYKGDDESLYERVKDETAILEAYDKGEISKDNIQQALANAPYKYKKDKKPSTQEEFEANRVSGTDVYITYNEPGWGEVRSLFVVTPDGYLMEGGNKVKSTANASNTVQQTFTLTDDKEQTRELDMTQPIIVLKGTVIDGNNRLRSGNPVKVLNLNSIDDIKNNLKFLKSIKNNGAVKEVLSFLKDIDKNRTYTDYEEDSDTDWGENVVYREYTDEQMFDKLADKIARWAGSHGQVTVPVITSEIIVPKVSKVVDENGEPKIVYYNDDALGSHVFTDAFVHETLSQPEAAVFLDIKNQKQGPEYITSASHVKSVFNIGPFAKPAPDLYRELTGQSFSETTLTEPELIGLPEDLQYQFKAVKIAYDNIDKIKSWAKRIGYNPEFWNKIQKDLGIPKDQIELLQQSKGDTIEEKLVSFASNYSYIVKIETATRPNKIEGEATSFYLKGVEYERVPGRGKSTYYKSDGINQEQRITEEEYYEAKREAEKQNADPTRYYRNLTVPGGTNYTENEIITPGIVPVIAGHAQFATQNGIGWFRSDIKTIVGTTNITELRKKFDALPDNTFGTKDYFGAFNAEKINGKWYWVPEDYNPEWTKPEEIRPAKADDVFEHFLKNVNEFTEVGQPSKTRRILEVQSDLFQKGRGLSGLTKRFKTDSNKTGGRSDKGNADFVIDGYEYQLATFDNEIYYSKRINKPDTWETEYLHEDIDKEEYTAALNKYMAQNNIDPETYSDQFLKLLMTDNNWVRFFLRSIVQDSYKKGYETVLFPKGNTATKIEGIETLETFKRNKEERLQQLNNQQEVLDQRMENGEFGMDVSEYELRSKKIQNEIETIEQELERIETEGLSTFKVIHNFYENIITATLKKLGYKPKEYTDEFNNSWNEIQLEPEHAAPIYFQIESENKAPRSASVEDKIITFLEKIGVQVKSVDAIHDAFGNKLDITAKVNMLNKIIEVIEDKAGFDTLPEEAAHFFVEMLGTGHPLYKEMYSKITGYKVYARVVEQYKNQKAYRNPDGSINFDKLKKEAMGKVIAEHIFKMEKGDESDARMSGLMGWFRKLWEFVTSLFIKADENPFETAAEKILNADTEGLTDITEDEEFYQIESSLTPSAKLLADQGNIRLDDSIDPRKGQKRHDYYYKGAKAKGSVTTNYVDPWLKKLFPTDQRSDYKKAIDLAKAEFGDLVHLQMKDIIQSWTNPDGTKRQAQGPSEQIIHPAFYKMLNRHVEHIMAQYEDGTRFFAEVKIFDQAANIGGSIDFLIIQPDGEVDIYDWKSQEIFRGQDDIKKYKEPMYRIQLEAYRRILEKQYGFTKFGKIRAIPIKTNFLYKENQIVGIKQIEIGNIDPTLIPDEKNYLLPVTLKNESTGDEEMDALIEKLNGIYDKIENKTVPREELHKKREELEQLRLVIRDLQLRNRIDRLVELGLLEHKKYTDKLASKTLTGKDIQEGIKILEVFSTSGLLLYELREQYAEVIRQSENKKLIAQYEAMNKKFLDMTSKVAKLIENMKKYRADTVKELGEKRGIMNLLDPEAPLGMLKGLFSSLSNITQKGFRLFSGVLREAQNSRDVKFEETATTLLEKKKKLQKWASAKGISMDKAMEMMLNIDKNGNWNGNFVAKYQAEAYKGWDEAIKNADATWISENMDFDEEKYEKEEKKLQKKFEEIQYAVDEKENKAIIKDKMEQWVKNHKVVIDGKINFNALMNRNNYFLTFKDKWLTDRWVNLHKPENAPVLEVYEYFQSLNHQARELNMLDDNVTRFIPSIHATNLEGIAFGNLKTLLNPEFFEKLEVDSGTKYTPQIDPTDGTIVNKIPVYFTKDMGVEREDGTIDMSKKSRDLFKVYGIWAAHMYNYEAMQSIEDTALMLVEVEKNKKSLVTDVFGNVVTDNGKVRAANANDTNAQALEAFVNYYLYDRLRGKDADVKFKVLNKEYSLLKTVSAAMNYFSLKTLGLNFTSAAAQFAGGQGNALFQAKKGIHFTEKTWAKAMYLYASSKKARAALDYFNILQEGNRNQLLDRLSVSPANRLINMDNAFILMRAADKSVQYPIGIAMMTEHMLDENNKIISIQKYVKDKYNYNQTFYDLPADQRKALRQKIDAEVKELQDTKSLLAVGKLDEKGNFSLPGVERDSETMSHFRSKVKGLSKKIIGNQTRDDINGIRTTMLGTAAMQFRNWIPEMVEERLSGLNYDDELQTWTYGKFNTFFSELWSKRFPTLIKSLITGFGDDAIKMAKEKYLILKADAERLGKDDEFKNLTEGEFVDLYIGNLRSMLAELIVLTGVFVTVTSMANAGGDDDENLKGLRKYATRIMKKAWNEFAFYYNPLEFTKLVKQPIPVVGLLEDVYRAIGAITKEVRGQVTGDEEVIKDAKPMKNLVKFLPVGKEALLMMATFDDSFRKEWDIRVENYFY